MTYKPTKVSARKKATVVTALSEVCFVCGKKRGAHTRKQALECDKNWPEKIKVK